MRSGLDAFGRVVDHTWGPASGNPVDRFRYGYDANGNRTGRENMLSTGFDEFYTYGDLNRLRGLQRGTLAGTHPAYTGIGGTPSVAVNWQLDGVGNTERLQRSVVGVAVLDQTRVHNLSNPNISCFLTNCI